MVDNLNLSLYDILTLYIYIYYNHYSSRFVGNLEEMFFLLLAKANGSQINDCINISQ